MSQQINLYNPIFRRKRTQLPLTTIVRVLGFMLAVLLLYYLFAVYRVAALNRQLEQSAARVSEKQTQLAEFSGDVSPEQARESLKIQLLQLEKKTADANHLADSLRQAGADNTAGYSEYMRGIDRQVMPGLWLNGFKVSGAQISLSGSAASPDLVSRYIRRLGSERVFSGRGISSLQILPRKGEAESARSVDFTFDFTPDSEERE